MQTEPQDKPTRNRPITTFSLEPGIRAEFYALAKAGRRTLASLANEAIEAMLPAWRKQFGPKGPE